jgi:translation initiation factor IF-2
MAKIKVHELAKEVGMSNREMLDYLAGRGCDVKTAVSAVPENEVEQVRVRFGVKKQAAKEENASGANADSREDAGQSAEDKPKKKGGIVRVFRSQNATRQLQKRPKQTVRPASKPSDVPDTPKNDEVKTEIREAAPDVTEKTKTATPVPSAPAQPADSGNKPPEMNTAEKTEAAEPAPAVKEEPVHRTEAQNITGESDADAKKPVAAATQEAKEKPVEQMRTQEMSERGTQRVQGSGSRPSVRTNEGRTGDRPRSQGGTRQGSYQGRTSGTGTDRRSDRSDNRQGGYQGRTSGTGTDRRSDRSDNRQGGYQGRNTGTGTDRRNDRSDNRQGGYQGRNTGTGTDRRNDRGDNRQGGYQGRSARPQGGRTFGGSSHDGGTRPQGGFQNRSRMAGAAKPAAASDGALAHKTTRDFHKDTKEKDRAREERRDNGRSSGNTARPNQQKRQFNRVPKALQKKQPQQQTEKKVEQAVTEIRVPERITIRDLAEKMKLQASQLVKELFMKGEMVTVNHEIPYEKAEEIALEHDILCEKEEKEDVIGALLMEEDEDVKDMVSRPPVVCVMGHVDHGKTSLLDAIRHTHVTDKEAGGITQAIGAYMVSVKGQKITFLDTPGHEAFTAMRMRGANSTDIAVLVVAADDGVMPQTVEAINHAKAANVDIIVAVNKIDKPGANLDRVKQELSEYGLIAEDWGGETVFCPVSAKTNQGIDNLLEMILLTSEVKELKANPDRNARGIVLEARLDKGRGPVASILIQKGTLHQGDFIACGDAHGKVRAMTDENGKRLHKATPSMPVEIIGLSDVPEAGEVLMSFDSDKEAKDFAAVFVSEEKKTLLEGTRTQMSLDDLFSQIKEGSLKELPIVVKADVQGSVEAVSQSLTKLSNEEVVVKVIHGGVGAITESDVSLAAASNAIIIGFAVRPDATAKSVADQQNVDIHLYNIIYEAIEDVERAINGMRAAVYEEQIQGHVEIRAIFKASKIGKIAGSNVIDGTITRSSKIRVNRGKDRIFEGELASLRIGKDDVKEVKKGFDCGLVFESWEDFEVGDIVEAYTMVEVERNDEKKQS